MHNALHQTGPADECVRGGGMLSWERAADWAWALLLAAPVLGSYVLARQTSGSVSAAAWVAFFVLIGALHVAGFIFAIRGWAEIVADEIDRPAE